MTNKERYLAEEVELLRKILGQLASGGGGDFIPLSGTEVGSPITGDLEMTKTGKGIWIKGANFPDDYFRINFGEGGIGIEFVDILNSYTWNCLFGTNVGIIGNTLFNKQSSPNAFAQLGDLPFANIQTSNFTAVNLVAYSTNGTLTVTDPTPETNKGYIVHVVGGTTTIDGIAYTAGALVYRFYNGTVWSSKDYGAGGGTYTDEQAQDAVGGILADTSEIDFTYSDGTPSITASLRNNSIANARLEHIAANRVKGRLSGNGVVQDIAMTDLPVSTATQTALDLKANIAGQVFTGNIQAPQINTSKQSLTPTGTTQSIDWNNGSIVDLVLSSATGNVTLTLLNAQNASSYLIEVTNGATPRNLIFPTGTLQSNGGGNVYVGIANQKDVIAVLWDGNQFLISVSRNFS